jgi:glycosyltransferase involved in cell wall biosynthesis
MLANQSATVAILLCTFNGAAFLNEQLLSIQRQTYPHWHLVASDDGSSDQTLQVLAAFQEKIGSDRMTLRTGPQSGFVNHFLTLVTDASIHADFFAFSDQDDIWEPDKLERALRWLGETPHEIPALYCSRTALIDEQGHEYDLSPLFSRPPSFANALVQNIAGGNTMVFNKNACRLIRECGKIDVPAHDWLVYLLVTASGGRVMYDAHPTVRYRLHPDNVIGPNNTQRARIDRLIMLTKGQFRDWINKNVAALAQLRSYMPDAQKVLLDEFMRARERHFFARVWGILCSGVYRQTVLGNIALVVAAALKKI